MNMKHDTKLQWTKLTKQCITSFALSLFFDICMLTYRVPVDAMRESICMFLKFYELDKLHHSHDPIMAESKSAQLAHHKC